MILLMKALEPRTYHEKTIIYEELQEILEITFVMTGTYFVGYEINKVKKMKIHRPPHTIMGGFESCFQKKSMFIYKCNMEITGYGLRRKNWIEIEDEFDFMSKEFKRHVFKDYEDEIRNPLLEQKAKDMATLENRADLTSVIAINDNADEVVAEIRDDLFEEEESEVSEFKLEKKLNELENLIVHIL